jgi:DNA-binding MarR family transcriptional regulator
MQSERLNTMFALVEAGRRMISYVETIWADVGLSPSEGAVLARLLITGKGRTRSGALLGHPIRSTPALGKVLANLESAQLISRERGAEDRRVVFVEATADGRELFEQVLARIESEVVTTTTSDLQDTDVTALGELISRLHR